MTTPSSRADAPSSPSSPAAPLPYDDHWVPPADDDGPQLPVVRIGGVRLTTLLAVVALLGGALFAVRAFISCSSSEVERAGTEVQEHFAR